MAEELTERLREYEALKFELAEVLRDLAALVPKDVKPAHGKLADLFARLAEDRFNLVFVGRFNRGKTSLMNALLGCDRLPTGVLPLTSAITSVAYGSAEKVQIEFQNGPMRYDIPMTALAEYVTERGNPGNVRGVREARIVLPAELLRRGFYFVDTPGLGSAIAENTQTTEAFFPEADAVLCVTAYDSPITDEETRALHAFARAHVPILVVINKQDTVSDAERDEVMTYVRKQLISIIPLETPPVLSVSAAAGLAAKLAVDPDALAASGISALEGCLVQLLTTVKGASVIGGVCERAAALFDELKPGDGQTLRERLARVLARNGSRTPADMPIGSVTASHQITTCEVCDRVGIGLYDFLRRYQRELADNSVAREQLATAGGFCSRHTWLYASMAQDRDICLALTPLIKRIANELIRLQTDCSEIRWTEDASPPRNSLGGACALCTLQERLELAALREVAKQCFRDAAATLQDPASVCVPHLGKLGTLRENRDPEDDRDAAMQSLARQLAAAADRLAEDMQRYTLRRDAIRRGLASEEETQAAKRALSFLAGSRAFPPQS